MTVFISGGVKNGKSSLAQDLAVKMAAGGRHYYVATMIPHDGEDRLRIEKHLESRAGLGFETVECGKNILSCLDRVDKNATFLLDSVTALLMNEMFPDARSAETDEAAAEQCAKDLAVFARSVKNAVIVSDTIYADGIKYDPVTERYRRHLANCDCSLAAACDTVVEMAGGVPVVHKGVLEL